MGDEIINFMGQKSNLYFRTAGVTTFGGEFFNNLVFIVVLDNHDF